MPALAVTLRVFVRALGFRDPGVAVLAEGLVPALLADLDLGLADRTGLQVDLVRLDDVPADGELDLVALLDLLLALRQARFFLTSVNVCGPTLLGSVLVDDLQLRALLDLLRAAEEQVLALGLHLDPRRVPAAGLVGVRGGRADRRDPSGSDGDDRGCHCRGTQLRQLHLSPSVSLTAAEYAQHRASATANRERPSPRLVPRRGGVQRTSRGVASAPAPVWVGCWQEEARAGQGIRANKQRGGHPNDQGPSASRTRSHRARRVHRRRLRQQRLDRAAIPAGRSSAAPPTSRSPTTRPAPTTCPPTTASTRCTRTS